MSAIAPTSTSAQTRAPSAEEVVGTLTTASHGINVMSGKEVMETFERVRGACGPYLGALKKRLEPSWVAPDSSGERARQASNAAAVLAACGAPGVDVLAGAFAQFTGARDQLSTELARRADALKRNNHPELVAKARQVDQVERIRTVLIDAMAASGDKRLRDPLLTRFESENYVVQLHALEYFKRATPRDSAVKSKLAPLLERRDSGFYQSQKLRSVIE